MLAPAPAVVQTTQGSRFFDPTANARGCLRMIAILFFVCVGVPLVLFLAKACAP